MVDELKKLILDLISYKTQNQNYEEIAECLKYIKKYFRNTNYICEVYEINKVKSLYIHKENCSNFDCFFSGHIDVVPAEESQFNAVIKGDKIIGRGAIDMKSQVATFLYLIKNYIGNKNIGALITSDEEIGGFNGTGKALDYFNIKANVAIVPDGGYNFQLINSERGVLQLDIEVNGKSAHSSNESQGINAIVQAVELYKEIKNTLNLKTPNCQSVNLASISTFNNVYNKVPDSAKMMVDIRYNVQTDIDYVYKLLNDCEYANYKVYAKANPFYIDTNNMLIKKYLNICKNVLKRDIDIIECYSASDARFFADKKIPVIMMNPVGQEMHGINEAVSIKSIEKLLNIYKKYMEVL